MKLLVDAVAVCSPICSDAETVDLRQRFRFLIEEALENLLSSSEELPQGRSRTQNMATPFGSLQSRVIFDGTNTLPKEVMLETTLKVLDYNYDIFEVCFNKVPYYHSLLVRVSDDQYSERLLARWVLRDRDLNRPSTPSLETTASSQTPCPGFCTGWRTKLGHWEKFFKESPLTHRDLTSRSTFLFRKLAHLQHTEYIYSVWGSQYSIWFIVQVPQDLLDDIKAGVRRLADKMHLSAAPEATAYLRLLGTEIGYMKSSDISKVAETLSMYYRVFFRALPSQVSSATRASQRTFYWTVQGFILKSSASDTH